MRRTSEIQAVLDRTHARVNGHELRADWYPHQFYPTPKRTMVKEKEDEEKKETTAAKTRMSFEDIWERSAKDAKLLKEIQRAYE